jgi:hypothetical protein
MRARAFRVSIGTEPPPTSVSQRVSTLQEGTGNRDVITGVAPSKPHLLYICNGIPFRRMRTLEILKRVVTVLPSSLGHLALLHAELIVLSCGVVPEARVEL